MLGSITRPALSGHLQTLVDAAWDWQTSDTDISCITGRSLPSTAPVLVFQSGPSLFAPVDRRAERCRQLAVGPQEATVELRPSGAMRNLHIRIRPEHQHRLLPTGLVGSVHLDDLFGTSAVATVAERLHAAPGPDARSAIISDFLAGFIKPQSPNPLMSRAAAIMRRAPSAPVHRVASQLDISERHLSRLFQAAFGLSPKRFARIARLERVAQLRRKQMNWAEIAYRCGFTDQAHLINEFTRLTGATPGEVFAPPRVPAVVHANDRLLACGFSTTLLIDPEGGLPCAA